MKKIENNETAIVKAGFKFTSGSDAKFIPTLSEGMNVALSVEQKILGKDAPLTTFGNDVIDDLLRDNWNLFYLASPSFTETPPEGREINRRLLEYFTSDPQWTMYHIFFANRKVASAAAAVTLT